MWLRMTQSGIRLAGTYAILAVVIVGDAAIVAWSLATGTADILSLVGMLVIFDLAAYVYVQIPFAVAHIIRGERGERCLHAQRLAYVLGGDPDADAKRARAKPHWRRRLRRCGRARPWSPSVPGVVAGHWQDVTPSEGEPFYAISIDRCRRLAKGLYEIRGTGRHAPGDTILCGYVNRNGATGETRLAWGSAHIMAGGTVVSYRSTGMSLEHRAVVDDTRSPAAIAGVLYVVNEEDNGDGLLPAADTRCLRFVLHRVDVDV
ncbi:Afd class i domain-containing protein [Pandoravirus kuranda]|uniref:Afd class i domain-containing protein n=2 Tax=Pandoravirus TaxID=2060084 RepID=A0AA95EMY6_9VIRU|nr:hypothetical protein pneo_cds_337 [Pandoravirus neocaledonia]AVK75944.1 hypothetical protein pneo_cds_337 [Pandoravirus neocaledonia]WBR14486.1 Afd class i domain-containing protein [Pandoravirus kuranda]